LLVPGVLLGLLGSVGEARPAVIPQGKLLLPELVLALYMLKSVHPTDHINAAIKDVESALNELGQTAVLPRTPSHKLGVLVLHERHQVRRALRLIRRAENALSIKIFRHRFRRGLVTLVHEIRAEQDLKNAVTELQKQLRTPFIF
jgi:hypothetical protein